MLYQEEISEIAAEMLHYPQKQAVCIEAMRIVQRHRGWVSDEAIQDIAGFLEMTPDELDSVATFYNLIFREPVGKHVILLCNSVSCWVMGVDRICSHIEDRLKIQFGQTTPDGQYTFLQIVCLGDCDHAPAMMVDNQLYHDLTPESIAETLPEYTGEQR